MAHQYYDTTSYDVMWLVKYENSFPTSREIRCTCITNIKQLMLSGNTFGPFCVSKDKHKYTIWPNGEVLMSEQVMKCYCYVSTIIRERMV